MSDNPSANLSLATEVIAAAIYRDENASGFTVGVRPIVRAGEIMVTVNGVLFRLTVKQV